jgi:hypothetical protein
MISFIAREPERPSLETYSHARGENVFFPMQRFRTFPEYREFRNDNIRKNSLI